MEKKYELTDNTKEYYGCILYRIKALKDFGDVEKGDLGGFVKSEDNLSQEGNCWIYDNAIVADNAKVYDNAKVSGHARVSDGARVYGYAEVYENAEVYGYAEIIGISEIGGDAVIKDKHDYQVFHNNWSSGRYFTYTKSNKMWKVGCFYGTGDELIKKAYKDNEDKGKHYEAYVNLVRQLEKIE